MLVIVAALAAQAPAQPPLELTCFGGGIANKVSVATANSNAHVYGTVGTTPVSGSGYGRASEASNRAEVIPANCTRFGNVVT